MDEAKALLATFLLQYEGESLRPYRCSAGVPTIGVGATTYPDGRKVTMKDAPITQQESRNMLQEECGKYIRAVEEMLTFEANVHQLVAMASLAYNVGIAALKKSTVLRAHNAGDISSASRAFSLWNKAKIDGKLTEVRGLTARRAAESALYLRMEPSPYKEPPVQAVAGESSLAASPINTAGASSVVAGGVAISTQLFGDTAPLISHAKEVATIFNVNPLLVFGIVIFVAGVVVMYNRYKQRITGWC
jgi:lysozyme